MNRISLITLFFVLSAVAGPVSVTMDSVSPMPVSDGQQYIGPYSVEIDGIIYGALCFDVKDPAYIGETWQANLISGTDLKGAYFTNQPNYRNNYLSAMYLFNKIMATPLADSQRRIDIQHAVWSLFDTAFPIDAGAQYWLAQAAAGRGSVDPSQFEVVAGIPDGGTMPQGMLIDPPSSIPPTADTPEPVTPACLGFGLILVSLIRFRR